MEEKHVRTPLANLIPSFRAHPPSPSPSAIPHCFLPRRERARVHADAPRRALPIMGSLTRERFTSTQEPLPKTTPDLTHSVRGKD